MSQKIDDKIMMLGQMILSDIFIRSVIEFCKYELNIYWKIIPGLLCETSINVFHINDS